MTKSNYIILSLVLIFMGCAHAKIKYHERYYQTELCNTLKGRMEVTLKDRTRVDCLSDKYAIEVDFAKKWAQSIGQSLYYAKMTGKKPAVGLIVDKEKDGRYLKRLELIAKEYNIKIFTIWTK